MEVQLNRTLELQIDHQATSAEARTMRVLSIAVAEDAVAATAGPLAPNARLIDDLGLNSVRIVQLIFDLEEEFGACAAELFANNLRLDTVADVVSFATRLADQS